MVCSRCIMVVENTLRENNIDYKKVEMGEVELNQSLDNAKKQKLDQDLNKYGFSLIDSKKSRIIEKIKGLINELIQEKNNELRVNFSQFLSNELAMDYSYLSNLFSTTENITIEKYIINKKIEKIKELIMYDELSLSEIADVLHYSSVQALSNQFKKVTGFSPAYYKKLKEQKRTEANI